MFLPCNLFILYILLRQASMCISPTTSVVHKFTYHAERLLSASSYANTDVEPTISASHART